VVTQYDSIDISTADFAFASLRTRPTMTFHPPIELGSAADSAGFWAATRHSDIVHVSRRTEQFCSGKGVGFSDIPEEFNEPFGSFLMTDAPRHTQLRRLVSRAFTPKRVALIEAQICGFHSGRSQKCSGSPRRDNLNCVERQTP
jgi:cytochrome P450